MRQQGTGTAMHAARKHLDTMLEGLLLVMPTRTRDLSKGVEKSADFTRLRHGRIHFSRLGGRPSWYLLQSYGFRQGSSAVGSLT
jgi:hypothetical protein